MSYNQNDSGNLTANDFYFDFVYTTGDIPLQVITISHAIIYHVHRSQTLFYHGHNPEELSYPDSNFEWRDTLTIDRTNGRFYTYAFSPRYPISYNRGFAYEGVEGAMDTAAWTIWVR